MIYFSKNLKNKNIYNQKYFIFLKKNNRKNRKNFLIKFNILKKKNINFFSFKPYYYNLKNRLNAKKIILLKKNHIQNKKNNKKNQRSLNKINRSFSFSNRSIKKRSRIINKYKKLFINFKTQNLTWLLKKNNKLFFVNKFNFKNKNIIFFNKFNKYVLKRLKKKNKINYKKFKYKFEFRLERLLYFRKFKDRRFYFFKRKFEKKKNYFLDKLHKNNNKFLKKININFNNNTNKFFFFNLKKKIKNFKNLIFKFKNTYNNPLFFQKNLFSFLQINNKNQNIYKLLKLKNNKLKNNFYVKILKKKKKYYSKKFNKKPIKFKFFKNKKYKDFYFFFSTSSKINFIENFIKTKELKYSVKDSKFKFFKFKPKNFIIFKSLNFYYKDIDIKNKLKKKKKFKSKFYLKKHSHFFKNYKYLNNNYFINYYNQNINKSGLIILKFYNFLLNFNKKLPFFFNKNNTIITSLSNVFINSFYFINNFFLNFNNSNFNKKNTLLNIKNYFYKIKGTDLLFNKNKINNVDNNNNNFYELYYEDLNNNCTDFYINDSIKNKIIHKFYFNKFKSKIDNSYFFLNNNKIINKSDDFYIFRNKNNNVNNSYQFSFKLLENITNDYFKNNLSISLDNFYYSNKTLFFNFFHKNLQIKKPIKSYHRFKKNYLKKKFWRYRFLYKKNNMHGYDNITYKKPLFKSNKIKTEKYFHYYFYITIIKEKKSLVKQIRQIKKLKKQELQKDEKDRNLLPILTEYKKLRFNLRKLRANYKKYFKFPKKYFYKINKKQIRSKFKKLKKTKKIKFNLYSSNNYDYYRLSDFKNIKKKFNFFDLVYRYTNILNYKINNNFKKFNLSYFIKNQYILKKLNTIYFRKINFKNLNKEFFFFLKNQIKNNNSNFFLFKNFYKIQSHSFVFKFNFSKNLIFFFFQPLFFKYFFLFNFKSHKSCFLDFVFQTIKNNKNLLINYNNLFFNKKIVSSSLKKFTDFFIKNKLEQYFSFFSNLTLLRFLEYYSQKKILLKFDPFILKNLNEEDTIRCLTWSTQLKSYKKSIGPGFFLIESLKIITTCLKLQDPFMFSNWILSMFYKMSFWSYKKLFFYLEYALRYYFWSYFKDYGIKGLKFQLKGKVSVAGNGRTRTVRTQIGSLSNSTLNNRILTNLNLLRTFTGVIGFRTWLVF